MYNRNETINVCPNCGTKVYTEKCHNCQAFTGLDTFKLAMSMHDRHGFYSNCKHEIIPFLIVTIIIIIILGLLAYDEYTQSIELYSRVAVEVIYIQIILSILLLIIGLVPLIKYILLLKNGEEKEALVLGYSGKLIEKNGKYKRNLELLTEMNGEKFRITYYMKSSEYEPYKINSKIKIKIKVRDRNIEVIEDKNE